jgi:peptidyl-prolyl cis-trans isomerase C
MKKKIALLLIATVAAASAIAAPAAEPFLARNEFATITKADFEAELARLAPEQQGALRASPERLPGFIEGLLVMKTLAAQARQAKLDESPAVQAEIKAAVDRTLAQKRLDQYDATLKAPDFTKRARELYTLDPKQYEEKALYNASHILVDFKCRAPDAAKARAEEARKVLLGGIPLDDVVSQYSDDPTASSNKGRLGWRGYDALNPTLQELLPRMKKGEVSEPVSSNFGFHVVILHDMKPARQRPFEEVKSSIIEGLVSDFVKAQRQQLVSAITRDPKIQVNLHAITALATAAAPAAPAGPVSPALSGATPPSAQSPALAPAPQAPGSASRK